MPFLYFFCLLNPPLPLPLPLPLPDWTHSCGESSECAVLSRLAEVRALWEWEWEWEWEWKWEWELRLRLHVERGGCSTQGKHSTQTGCMCSRLDTDSASTNKVEFIG